MRVFKILFVIFFLFSIKSFGTAQTPDYLIFEKDTLRLHCNPLEEYFKKNPIPKGLITSFSTANWRGYIAYFKFVDNKLVVENIYKEEFQKSNSSKFKDSLISIYNDVFGLNTNFECDFYTGLLVCPHGKLLEYVHMGYSSLYENYKLFEIGSGTMIKSKDFTGEEFQKFKINYYRYYKTTEEYKVKAAELKKMMLETNDDVENAIQDIEGKKNRKKKENPYLKQKEAEYKVDKELDNFMFIFFDDYIKTIEIPKNK